MAVEYNDNNISINLSNTSREKSVSVYAHPGDKLSFNIDISSLKKEVIKGDLIIHLLNGSTVTVVNFGLMALDNKAPSLVDSTGTEYNPLSLFQGTAYFSANGVDSYIVSREVSSPEDNTSIPGDKYRTAKDMQDGSGLEASKSGSFPVEDQNPVPEFGPSFEDYVQKTLMNLGVKNNISETDFSSTKGFKYTDKSDDNKPVKLLIINPKLNPEYGAQYSLGEKDSVTSVSHLDLKLGGGSLKGTDYAYYQYTPEKVVINAENAVFFDGPNQTDTITRYITIYIDNKLVRFTGVTLSGLPNGITIPSGNTGNLSVNPAGAGGYQIDINGGSANGEVRIPIQYKVGEVGDINKFGALDISYEGVLSTTGDIVRGSSVFYFNFLPVQGESDIQNGYNNYTYSTLRDPLEIVFPNYNNEIRGGKGNYTYVGGSGDDTAVGGEATETFNLGGGNNTFYAGLYNDTVTNGIGSNAINKLYFSDAINKADANSTKIVIDNGLVYFSGTNFESTMSNFTDIYLDVNRYGAATEREDNIIINSTKLLNSNIITHFGDGDNTVTLNGDTGFEISFIKNDRIAQGDLPIYVSSRNSTAGVFLDWEGTKNSKNWIVGSKPGDSLVFSADATNISYDASGSTYSTADYSNLLGTVGGDFNFDASTCEVSRSGASGGSVTDRILGIKEIIGDSGQNNLFFGALTYEDRNGGTHYSQINYIGGNKDISKNVLSYEKMASNSSDDILNNGVTINMEARTVEKNKNSAFVDTFENIGSVIASENNDLILAANSFSSNSLDGKGGDNTISYKFFSSNINIEISDYSGTSNVYKGSTNSGYDTLRNFNHFIGSGAQTNFSLEGSYDTSKPLNSKRYDLDGGVVATSSGNSISYQNVSSVNMALDLNLSGNMLASVLNAAGNTIFYDQLHNISSFTLSSQASNVIYMYEQSQLSYIINAGNGGTNNVITFEKAQQSVSLDFKNESYNNISNVNKLVLSNNNDTVVMGFNFFAQVIDGGDGSNLIDLSILNSPINQDFNLDNVGLDNLVLGASSINVRNFQRIISGSGDDFFRVVANLDDIDNYAVQNFFIDGSLGDNQITFEGVSQAGSALTGLNIDLSKYLEDGALVSYSDSFLMSFKNFSNIIGSNYDDVFVLPDYDFVFTIDGGLGTNTVSYQSYENGVFITRDTLLKFTNIQKIVGSQGNDKISIDETSSLNVDGGNKGFNTAIYSGVFNTVASVVVDYSNNKQALVTKGSNVDTLTNIQYFNFKGVSDGGALNSITVNIKNPIIGDRPVFFSVPVNKSITNGGVANLEYSAANSFDNNVNLNLSLNSNPLAEGNWISLRGLDTTEESINFQNFSSLTMKGYINVGITDYTSLIASLQDITSLTINNTEDLHNGLNLQDKTGDVTIRNNVFSEQYNNGKFDLAVNKIGKIVGSNDLNSSLDYIGVNPDYTNKNSQFVIIVAGMGKTNIDYRSIVGNLNINLSYNSAGENLADVSATSGSDTVKINEIYGDVTKYLLSNSFSNTINFNLKETDNGVTFDGGQFNKSVNNIINYSSSIASSGVYNFNIIGDGNITVSRYYGNNIDTYINFYDVSLNLGRSKVTFDDTLKNASKAYNIRMEAVGTATDSKVVELDLSAFSDDLNFSMTNSQTAGLLNIINAGSTKVSVNFDTNSHLKGSDITLRGSLTNVNTFTLGYFFDGVFNNINSSRFNLTVLGNNLSGNNNILDLTDYSNAVNLSAVDGLINAVGNSNLYINAKSGIQIIKLGDGDNILDISSNANVDWGNIIGGKGRNSVSFANLQAPILYDLAEGFDFGSSKIQLTNFKGIIGTQFNDVFTLHDNNNDIAGVDIDGGGGNRDTLDYNLLSIGLEINTVTGRVIRKSSSGDITDTVKNIDVFIGGAGGSSFISSSSIGSYTFIGSISAINSSRDNMLSYNGVSGERLVFNFVSNSVTKNNGDYDNFSNINKFYGGIGQNIFMFKSSEFTKAGIRDIYLYGNSNATENVLDFSQEDFNLNKPANITFTIATNSIKVNSSTTVHIDGIYSIIGTRGADTYIFGNSVNGYTVSGINNSVGVSDTINLKEITSAVTVDFQDLTISYGKNVNHFVKIETFYGSDKAENNFLNLNYFSTYNISVDQKNSSNSKVSYQKDTPLAMSLSYSGSGNNLVVTKSGSKFDNFQNIKEIVLSNGINHLSILDKDALKFFLTYMKRIDLGNSGINALSFSSLAQDTVNEFTIDLQNNNIITKLNGGRSESYTNTITNFNIIQISNFKMVSASYIPKIIFGNNFNNITNVSFYDTQRGSLDLSNILNNLNVNIGSTKETTFNNLEDGSVLRANRLHDLTLGKVSYNINYTAFGNSFASNLQINNKNALSTTISIISLDTNVNSMSFTQSSSSGYSIEAKSASGGSIAVQNYSIVNRLNINEAPVNFNFTSDLSKSFYLYVNAIGANNGVITIDLSHNTFFGGAIVFNMYLATAKINPSNNSNTLTTEILADNLITNLNVKISTGTATIIFNEMPNLKYNIDGISIKKFELDFAKLGTLAGINQITLTSGASDSRVKIDLVDDNGGILKSSLSAIIASGISTDITLSQYNNNRIILDDVGSNGVLHGNMSNIYTNEAFVNISSTKSENLSLTSSGLTVKNNSFFNNTTTELKFALVNIIFSNPLINNLTLLKSDNSNLKKIQVEVYNGLRYLDFGLPGSNTSRVDIINFNENKQYNLVGNIILGEKTLSGTFKGANELSFKNFNYLAGYKAPTNNDDNNMIVLGGDSNTSTDNISFTLDSNLVSLNDLLAKTPNLFLELGYRKEDSNRTSIVDFSKVKISITDADKAVVYITSGKDGIGMTLVDSHTASSIKPKIFLDNLYKLSMQIQYANMSNNGALVIFETLPSSTVLTQSVNLGDMGLMRLPTTYKLFISGTQDSWVRPSSANALNQYGSYPSFYNVFAFKGNFDQPVSGVLFKDSNNSSIFTTRALSSSSDSTYTIKGVNLIWGPDNVSSTLSINRVESAHKFAVLLYENAQSNTALSNIIDFEDLTDSGSYRFYMGQDYDKTLRGTALQVLVSKKQGNSLYPSADDTYGTLSGFTKLSLTFGNDVFVPTFNSKNGHISFSDRYVVDGTTGVNTLDLYNDTTQNSDLIEFKGDANNAGITYNNIEFKNFKEIITPSGTTTKSITYRGLMWVEWAENTTHNFIIKHFSGDTKYASINFESIHQSSSAYTSEVVFFNNKNTLIVSSVTQQINTPSFLFSDVHVNSIATFDGTIVLSNNLDLGALTNNEALATTYINNTGVLVSSQNITIYYTSTNPNYRIYYDNNNPTSYYEDTVNITSSDGSHTLKISSTNGTKFHIEPIWENTVHSVHTLDYLYGLSDESNNYASDVNYSGSSKFNSEGYKVDTNINGSSNIQWKSENKYIENANHYYANEDYWKSVDSHIEKVVINKEDSKPYMNAFLEEFNKQQNGKVENASEDSKNKNEDSNTSGKEEYNVDNLSEDNVKQNIDSNIKHNNDNFDLNAILQAAKNMHSDSYKNDNNVMESLGFKNISSEVLEDTYRQDEANSMGYTIDASYNYHDSNGESSSGCALHDNQKNKINHH